MSARPPVGMSSHEPLPALRSTSPPPALHRSLNKPAHESLTLPPIHSLTRDLPRIDHRNSDPTPSYSTQDQSQYPRKRAAGVTSGEGSPPPFNKRRKVEATNEPQAFSPDRPKHTVPSADVAPRRQFKQPHQHQLDPQSHPAVRNSSPRSIPTAAPADSRRLAPASSRPSSHEPNLKQEQPSPPAVVVQSPATPSTSNTSNPPSTAWQTEPTASFSRRILNQPSTQRSTPRKQPPSRLTFQAQTQRSIDSTFTPAIRSAPPVPAPVPTTPGRPLGGTWLSKHSSRTSASHQGRAAQGSQPAEASTPVRSMARQVYPSIPTPTSLRLGAHQIVPPPLTPHQATAASPSGRMPLTPAAPSPIPTLGSGTGLVDKAKFIQKMSEIYDRANAHKQCITLEEIDKRIKEALSGRDQEIINLKKEITDLRRLVGEARVPGADGDVAMTTTRPAANGESPASDVVMNEDPTLKTSVPPIISNGKLPSSPREGGASPKE